MNGITAYREQVQWSHEFLDMVTADVTPEQAQWRPPGIANPLGAVWAHAVWVEDSIIQSVLKGDPPLFSSTWAGKAGTPEPAMHLNLDNARQSRLDLAQLRQYARAVYGATDDYLSSLADSDLDRRLDLSKFGFGEKSVGWVLNVLLVSHTNNMIGEISCLKGLQGAKGYPF
jgi:hypothetical protein